jgi:hypothetical protein
MPSALAKETKKVLARRGENANGDRGRTRQDFFTPVGKTEGDPQFCPAFGKPIVLPTKLCPNIERIDSTVYQL